MTEVEKFKSTLKEHSVITMLKRAKGCSGKEVEEIERLYNVSLPSVYCEFLSSFGRSAGELFVGTDMFFHHLKELRSWAIELLEESESKYALSKNDFVFSVHQGYEFLFFNCNEGQNPPVYQYIEEEEKPIVTWGSFTDYLNDALNTHLAEKEKIRGLS